MNDLMTKSFLSYVELKRQAVRDLEDGDYPAPASPDDEEERQLIRFYEEVGPIQQEMDHISGLLLELRHLIEEAPTARGATALRALRDRVDSGVSAVLREAGDVRSRLAALDRRHRPPAGHGGGGAVHRARSSVTRALRAKLGEMMGELRRLRERSASGSVGAGRFDATGGVAGDDAVGKPMMRSAEGEERAAEGREGAAGELQRSLERLRGVFADMAALVDGGGEQLEDIEGSVARARVYIGGGTGRLAAATRMKREARRSCVVLVWALVLVLLLTCLILMFTGS